MTRDAGACPKMGLSPILGQARRGEGRFYMKHPKFVGARLPRPLRYGLGDPAPTRNFPSPIVGARLPRPLRCGLEDPTPTKIFPSTIVWTGLPRPLKYGLGDPTPTKPVKVRLGQLLKYGLAEPSPYKYDCRRGEVALSVEMRAGRPSPYEEFSVSNRRGEVTSPVEMWVGGPQPLRRFFRPQSYGRGCPVR